MNEKTKEQPLVLVTGASGYVASHIINNLLGANYKVRGTVRSLKNENNFVHLKELSPRKDTYPIELVEADLMKDDGWKKAISNCDFVVHIAAPLPPYDPPDVNEVLLPTVEGTLRILQACADQTETKRVKRVVMLHTIAAILGHLEESESLITESQWTDLNSPVTDNVARSKTIAERNAWEFVNNLPNDQKFEFTVLNSGFALGPIFHNTMRTSQEMLCRMMDIRRLPLIPEISLNLCDVRDLAEASFRAMTLPKAAGQRIIFITNRLWIKEIANVLHEEFTSQGYRVPQTSAPFSVLWISSVFDRSLKQVLRMCDKEFKFDDSKALSILNLTPRDISTTIVDAAYSYIERGLVPKTNKFKAVARN